LREASNRHAKQLNKEGYQRGGYYEGAALDTISSILIPRLGLGSDEPQLNG